MTSPVRFEVRGPLGLLTLSRPRALNALDLEMIHALRAQLDAWAEDARVHAVLIRGEGERAFCAGGDVRAVATAPMEARPDAPGEPLRRAFFRDEYALNQRIHHYPKPFIALVDGICMGGGLGVSVHGSHRVVGERLVLAMPETAIGFFPDVGGGWFLPRFPGESGTYLALTGARAGAADALWLGYATHHVPAARFEALTQALAEADWRAAAPREVATRTLAAFHQEAGASALAALAPDVDRVFSHGKVAPILEALAREPGEWAARTHAALSRLCPTSLAVTLRLLREGRARDYDADVAVEYRLSQRMALRHDFREGVRAVLVDKDGQPRWSPATLDEVRDADVDALFAPLDEALRVGRSEG